MKSKIWSAVRNLDLFLAIVALAALVTVTFLGVFMRYVFNSPFPWLDEVQMIFIVWLTCFGASAAVRHGGHIAIDMIVALLPGKVQRGLSLVAFVIVFFMLGFLAWNSFALVWQQYSFKRVTDILLLPRAGIFAALPVSAVIMMASFTALAVKEFCTRERRED